MFALLMSLVTFPSVSEMFNNPVGNEIYTFSINSVLGMLVCNAHCLAHFTIFKPLT